MSEKVEFHKISIEDCTWMTEKLKEENPEACEYTFVNNYIWRNSYEVEAAQICGCGVIRYQDKKGYRFSYPFGNGDKKEAILALKAYCRENLGEKYKLDLCPITDKHREELMSWFPGEYIIESDRDDFDYIYLTEDLANLKGKKYHGKRNHIARFMDDDDWSYETLTTENLEECRRMEKEWLTFREEKWEEGVDQETLALQEAFDHYEEFGLVGGLIRKDGKVVAFTIGEPLNDEMMVVHFEKAYPDLQGAYPMINQQFILHECTNYKYVNREEDVGDPGLRKAKLSYYPEILLHKYNAVESDVVFASENDLEQIKIIWQTCFGDEDDYIRMYLEHRFDTENMLVIHRDGKPVSMASILPAQLKQGEEWTPVRYVYAVATLPEYQENGYASRILQYASDKYKEPLILQPAEKNLEDYYEKLGFVKCFEKEDWEISPAMEAPLVAAELSEELTFKRAAGDGCGIFQNTGNSGEKDFKDYENHRSCDYGWHRYGGKQNFGNAEIYNDMAPAEISPAEYKEVRDAHFDRNGYVSWEESAIEYALLENNFCNGQVLKMGDDIILYRMEDDVLRVVETTLEDRELQKQVQKLLSSTHARKAVYHNQGGMIKYPEGMEKTLGTEDCGYLNLTLG